MMSTNNLKWLKTKGNSMEPSICSGDKLYMERIQKDSRLFWGEVVVFLYKGQLVAHRIILITPQLIITKGDNSNRGEIHKSTTQIIGRVSLIKKKVGSRYIESKTNYLEELTKAFVSLIIYMLHPRNIYLILMWRERK